MQLYHTFISYAREDGDFALRLANNLRGAGVNVWLDQLDIPPGARWDRAVETALETCGRLLVILSPTSTDSENVQDEIGLALDSNKPIVPILASACEVPMRLRRMQYIDFTADYDSALQTLLTVLKLPVTAPEAGADAAPTPPAQRVPMPAAEKTRAVRPSAVDAKPAGGKSRLLLIVGGVAAAILLLVVLMSGGDESTTDQVAAGDAAATDGAAGESGGTESTLASMATIKVVNRSDWQIHEIFMRQAGEQNWSQDLLGADVIINANGGEHTVKQVPCGNYDLRLVDEDGDECVLKDENLCEQDLVWELTSKDLISCQGASRADGQK